MRLSHIFTPRSSASSLCLALFAGSSGRSKYPYCELSGGVQHGQVVGPLIGFGSSAVSLARSHAIVIVVRLGIVLVVANGFRMGFESVRTGPAIVH